MTLQPVGCPWCSTAFTTTIHSGPCPRVKAIDYYPNGTVKHVEFHQVPPTSSHIALDRTAHVPAHAAPKDAS